MQPPPSAAGREFPSTRWSRILATSDRRDLDALAQAYWRPIRAWLMARLRLPAEQAHELTQEAFAWMLQTRFLDRADPARGRFRGLLKKALANFAIEQFRHDAAQKRGGGQVHLALEAAADVVDARAPAPDEVLDACWRRELLERARQQLEAELTANGRATHWRLFAEYFLDDGGTPDHRTLASRHGISTTDVSNWLDHAKRRYRALLRALVAETVGSEEELQVELRWLFGTRGA
jgi:RNA polymerase sigma-70 factor (ECF subfamily)